MDITQATERELRNELDKRARNSTAPHPLAKPDFKVLEELVISNVSEQISNGIKEDDDTEYYIYEEALTAVYGKDYWKWLSQKQ